MILPSGKEKASKAFTMPCEGDPVDMVPWAYVYRRGSMANPAETKWLFPGKFMKMEVINGSMTWQYLDSPDFVRREDVLAGLLWEEPRPIERVVVEFPTEPLPGAEDVQVFGLEVGSMWEDVQAWKSEPVLIPFTIEGTPLMTEHGTMRVVFRGVGKAIPKIYVQSKRTDLAVLAVEAYGLTSWVGPSEAEIEWGYMEGANPKLCYGSVEVYNGCLVSIAPLAEDLGALSIDGAHWREREGQSGRHGVKIRILITDEKAERDRTVVSLRTTLGDFSFAWGQLANGPIFVPSLGMGVVSAGSTTLQDFLAQRAGHSLLTTRQSTRADSEVSWASAMERFHGRTVYPAFPEPALEPPMRIHVPEPELEAQWRLGAWHLLRWAQPLPDGRLCVSIWPFTKGDGLPPEMVDGHEGMVAIGCESYQILRTLDLLGCHEAAEQGLNYWIDGDHDLPFVYGADVMGQDSLVNSFNSPNRRSPGYDQKHSGGHGKIMQTAAFHYRLTRNDPWLEKVGPALERAAQAVLRVRRVGMRHLDPSAWCYGLIPPSNTSDLGSTRVFYYQSAAWFGGLLAVADILNTPSMQEIKAEADQAVEDLRRAVYRAMVMSPVETVHDGTCRQWPPYTPHLRGIMGMQQFENRFNELVLGALQLISNGIYKPDEPVVNEWLDVFEDNLVQDGQNGQNGYNDAIHTHLLIDDVPLFLRGMYHAYAAEVDPDLGYIFWEGEKKGGTSDKTFEEAAFLERVRNLLVMEEGPVLWLARATPRAWLEQGKQISVTNAPTYFGAVDYAIISDVDNGKITATVKVPSRNPVNEIWLRLRHPQMAPIQSVQVNGAEWKDFDPAREFVILHDTEGTACVAVTYGR